MKNHTSLRLYAALVAIVLVLFSLGFSTYAWFTENHAVSTSKVQAEINSANLSLAIASSEGGLHASDTEQESDIARISGNPAALYPVSTSDCKSFIYKRGKTYALVADDANQNYYYHGRFFIEAIGDNQPEGTQVALYLSKGTEVSLVSQGKGSNRMPYAARIGLTIDGQAPKIYCARPLGQDITGATYNTDNITGFVSDGSQVLTWQDGQAVPVAFTPLSIDDSAVDPDDTGTFTQERRLLLMDLNKVYTVDVYFYLEGTDNDCVDEISGDEMDFFLAFYGALETA